MPLLAKVGGVEPPGFGFGDQATATGSPWGEVTARLQSHQHGGYDAAGVLF
jgi:hypothetical protein